MAVIFLQGCNIVLKREIPVLTFKYITFLKHIKKTDAKHNRDQQRAVQIKFVIFYNKNGQALCRHYSSLINWPLSAIFNWQLGRVLMSVAAVER